MNKYLLARHNPLVVSLSLAVFAFLLPTLASAQTTPPGLSLTPPTIEISGNPGDRIKNTFRLDNTTSDPVRIAVDRRNFTAVGEEGAVGLTEEETPFSLASWISVEPSEIVIPGHGSQTFRLTISIPSSAEAGGHFGSVVFRTVPITAVGATGATVSQELGGLLLVKIAGNTKELASIKSFAPAKSFYEQGPITLDLRVENEGNVHVKPVGTVVITDQMGKEVGKLAIDSKNILPGAVRKYDATWSQKYGFGRYTATAVVTYDKSGTQLTSTTTFTLFPARVVGAVLIALIIIIIFFYQSRKRLSLAFKVLFSGKV